MSVTSIPNYNSCGASCGYKCNLISIIGGLTWRVSLVTFWTCVIFAPSSFNFGLLTYSVSHYCYGRPLYAVFCRSVCLKKSRAELLTVMSKVTHLLVCIVLTPCFVLLVQLALIHLKIKFWLARDWCRFPSRDYRTHQSAWAIFFSWDRCLRLSLSLLTLFVIWHLAPHDSNIDSHAYRIKSVDLIFCVLYAAME